MRKYLLCAALALTLVSPAISQNTTGTAPRIEDLDKLFGRLKTGELGEEQRTAQSRIWSIWMQSGSITHDLILQQATMAMIDAEYYTSEEMLNVLIDRRPDFAEAYNKRAELYFLMGRLDDALSDIDVALEREPRHFGAMAGRGLILQWLGRDKEALQAYRDALAVNSGLKGVEAAAKILERQSPAL
jgi:tetratricopeptide (TPR) repeat protein